MQKKKIVLSVLSALILSGSAYAGSAAAADNDLFKDVPTDHWAYQAVTQLAKDGVITGYGNGTFQGNRNITRYEMAQMIANARTHMPKAANNDKELIDKLSEEFEGDLDALGVRVQKLEKKVDNVRITGSFAQKYSKTKHTNMTDSEGKTENRLWEKELDLNLEADIPKTPLTFHSTFKTILQSKEGNGFNSEEEQSYDWNNGNSRKDSMRLDTCYVEGPLNKKGLNIHAGTFVPSVQNGFVNDSTIRGASLTHTGKHSGLTILAGKLDIRDDKTDEPGGIVSTSVSDTDWTKSTAAGGTAKAVTINGTTYDEWHSTTTTYAAAKNTTDFVRYTAGGAGSVVKTTYYNNDWSWETPQATATEGTVPAITTYDKSVHKDLYGLTYDHTWNKMAASVGGYRYKSGAYGKKPLLIAAGTLNYQISKKIALAGAYAHGNQHGNNKAWNAELQFNGAPYFSGADAHRFGYYLAYRYLGPDAIVKTIYEDGAKAGQKGWETGLFYNITSNLQYKLKYFHGKSITSADQQRSKVYTSLEFDF